MVLWTYFRFLAVSLLKKKSIWIFGVLYLIFSFLLLIVVPLITKNNPWQLWHNTALNPQTLLLYIMTIFGAIMSIAIFKEYRDDGTELILVTKPINRTKATVAKFILFFSFAFIFSLISLINAPITLIFKDVTADQASSLALSMMFSNFMVLVIFGMLATLISLFANKIWTILANVILVVLLIILSTVNALVVKTPAALAKTDNHAIVSTQYLGNDNKMHTFASLTPTVATDQNNYDISFTTFEQEKEYWKHYTQSSSSRTANYFDFPGQFTLLNNMGAIRNELTAEANRTFGSNHFYDYEFQKPILQESDDILPSYFVHDPDDDFGSIGKFDITNQDTIKESLERIVEKYLDLLLNQEMIMIGSSEIDASPLVSSFVSKKNKIAEGNNGWSGAKNNLISYDYDDLKMTNPLQSEVFDKIIEALLKGNVCKYQEDLQKIDNFFEHPDTNPNFGEVGDDVLQTLWNASLADTKISDQNTFKEVLDEDSLKNCDGDGVFYNFFHACLVGANKGLTELDGNLTTGGKYMNIFWDSSLTDESKAAENLMKVVAMFKLYTFQKLTKFIKDKNIYKLANNTSVNIGNYNFSSQPLLPLNLNSEENAYNMNINILGYDIPIGILYAICPSLNYDLRDFQEWIPSGFGWANAKNNEPSYYTDEEVLNARAILWWVARSWWRQGYSDAIDSGLKGDEGGGSHVAFEREENYNVRLITSVVNYPMVYECLGATYKATPQIQTWEIILIWTFVAILLTGLSFTIYIRADFK